MQDEQLRSVAHEQQLHRCSLPGVDYTNVQHHLNVTTALSRHPNARCVMALFIIRIGAAALFDLLTGNSSGRPVPVSSRDYTCMASPAWPGSVASKVCPAHNSFLMQPMSLIAKMHGALSSPLSLALAQRLALHLGSIWCAVNFLLCASILVRTCVEHFKRHSTGGVVAGMGKQQTSRWCADRWVAMNSRNHGIFAAHSIILCFMCGPIGLLSHILTRLATEQWRTRLTSYSQSTAV